MKRVIFITKNTIDSDQRTLAEANFLAKAGLKVTIIGLQRNQDLPLEHKNSLEIIRVRTTFQLTTKFKDNSYLLFKQLKLIRQYNRILSIIKQLDQRLKPLAIYTNLALRLFQEKADYYHCHFPFSLIWLTMVLVQFKKGKFVLDYNNILVKENGSSPQRATLKYYDQDHLWGKSLIDREQMRLRETISYIPEEVKSILDLGCGDGRLTNQLINVYPKVIGLDNSPVALSYVKGEKVLGSATNIPFPDSSFNLVVSTELIEHLPQTDYQKVIQEMKRVANNFILLGVPWQEQLSIGKVYCANCENYFHANYHFRSFNDHKLSRLFLPEFQKIKSQEIGTTKRYYSPLLLLIKQQLGGIWTRTSTTVCPRCSTALGLTDYPERNAISVYCDRKNNQIRENKQLPKSHIIALYQKIN